VNIGLNARAAAGREEFLSISVIPIDRFRRKPAIEVITVAYKNASVSVPGCRLPFPVASLVKKPVPWRLISDHLSCAATNVLNSNAMKKTMRILDRMMDSSFAERKASAVASPVPTGAISVGTLRNRS